MLSSLEIKNIKFSKAMGGYKQEEVDVLLDKYGEHRVLDHITIV